MIRKPKSPLIGLLCLVFPLGLAVAADEGTTNPSTDNTVQEENTVKEGNRKLLSANKLIGTEVVSQDNEELGDLHDLIIDAEKGKAPFAVLALGGVLGVGDEHFAVPWEGLTKKMTEDGECRLHVKRVEKAPFLEGGDADRESATTESNENWADSVLGDYEIPPFWIKEGEPGESQPEVNRSGQYLSANEVLGHEIRSTTGEDIGDIEDLRLKNDGTIDFVVVDLGAFFESDREMLAIPWDRFKLETDVDAFTLQLTSEHIRNAPRFEEKDDEDQTWGQSAYDYYQNLPYWK